MEWDVGVSVRVRFGGALVAATALGHAGADAKETPGRLRPALNLRHVPAVCAS